MTEPVANILKDRYSTIGGLEDALIDNTRRSAYERAFANYYANAGGRKDGGEHTFNQYLSHIISSEGGEETLTPVWYDTDGETMATIPTMQKGTTALLITGDASRNKIQTMPGGGNSMVKIELPANWNTLMAAKGYSALSDMYLTSTVNVNDDISSVSKDRFSTSADSPVRFENYDIQGRRAVSRQRGVYIRRNYYNNGTSQS